jgi:hypothetical protein
LQSVVISRVLVVQTFQHGRVFVAVVVVLVVVGSLIIIVVDVDVDERWVVSGVEGGRRRR